MYDAGKVISGLVIFVGLVTFPFWFTAASGKIGYVPDLQQPAGSRCVEDTEYMRGFHMELLDQWRDAVVRDGKRVYVAQSGDKHEMSLSSTCLGSCHASKTQFCDKCHSYVGVSPYCFDCHIAPEM